MTSKKEFLTPNDKIALAIFWFVIAIVFISDRFINNLNIRLWDWIGWIGMLTAGIVYLIEGFRMKKITE
jgi:hypothetical protein